MKIGSVVCSILHLHSWIHLMHRVSPILFLLHLLWGHIVPREHQMLQISAQPQAALQSYPFKSADSVGIFHFLTLNSLSNRRGEYLGNDEASGADVDRMPHSTENDNIFVSKVFIMNHTQFVISSFSNGYSLLPVDFGHQKTSSSRRADLSRFHF